MAERYLREALCIVKINVTKRCKVKVYKKLLICVTSEASNRENKIHALEYVLLRRSHLSSYGTVQNKIQTPIKSLTINSFT